MHVSAIPTSKDSNRRGKTVLAEVQSARKKYYELLNVGGRR